jgi:aryl-alcohol dehydrogenase-like predicted oxidoreductase
MNYVNLGRTGLKVSPICLGTMNFGPRANEPESHALMDAALDAGIQFFDTADVYGWKTYEGYTEQIVGDWIAASGKRDRIVLATKFQGEMGTGPNERGASAKYIRSAVEASLKRLKTDYIDLYQMHHINRDTPWDEVWQAMEVLVQQGKILYAGSSNHPGWQIARANEAASRRNFLGYVSEQCKLSLLCRFNELEVLPACQAYGLGVIPWSPLEGGILGGRPQVSEIMRRGRVESVERVNKIAAQLDAWEALCKELGHTPSQVGLAWTLHLPAVTAPIIGPRTMEQLNDALGALEVKLDRATLDRIDTIFPPAGDPEMIRKSTNPYRYETPEAFAW